LDFVAAAFGWQLDRATGSLDPVIVEPNWRTMSDLPVASWFAAAGR